jgi:hypothetical protein
MRAAASSLQPPPLLRPTQPHNASPRQIQHLPHGRGGLQPVLEVRLDGGHQLLLLPLLQLSLRRCGCGWGVGGSQEPREHALSPGPQQAGANGPQGGGGPQQMPASAHTSTSQPAEGRLLAATHRLHRRAHFCRALHLVLPRCRVRRRQHKGAGREVASGSLPHCHEAGQGVGGGPARARQPRGQPRASALTARWTACRPTGAHAGANAAA